MPRKNGTTGMTKGLWRYNAITGEWKLERTCAPETAEEWLKIFQKDEPEASFKLSRKKPSGKP